MEVIPRLKPKPKAEHVLREGKENRTANPDRDRNNKAKSGQLHPLSGIPNDAANDNRAEYVEHLVPPGSSSLHALALGDRSPAQKIARRHGTLACALQAGQAHRAAVAPHR